MVAIAAALAITYAVAEAVASPSIIAPTWLTLLLARARAARLGRDLHRLQPLRAPEPEHLAGHLRRGRRALPRADRRVAVLPDPEPGARRVMEAEVFFPVEAAMFLATALPLVLLTRGSVRSWLLPAIMQPRRTLIVGTGDVAQMVERKISSHPEYRPRARGLRGRAAPRRGHRARWSGRPPTCRGWSTSSRSTGSSSPSRAPPTRRRSSCCARPAARTCTSRSCRASSRCSPPTPRSRSWRACRS